jgi:hypothetical protein
MPLNHRHLFCCLTFCCQFLTVAHAIDYQQLAAAKQLTNDKRYDEAIQKLEALAAKTEAVGENFHYLDLAMDIT